MIDELRGGTHMHAAAYVGKPAVLMWLLEHGVDKDHKTKKGKTFDRLSFWCGEGSKKLSTSN